jgi:hypothetical protein
MGRVGACISGIEAVNPAHVLWRISRPCSWTSNQLHTCISVPLPCWSDTPPSLFLS